MTGKEIVRLINRLEKEGMSSDKILDIIKEVGAPELRDVKEETESESTSAD